MEQDVDEMTIPLISKIEAKNIKENSKIFIVSEQINSIMDFDEKELQQSLLEKDYNSLEKYLSSHKVPTLNYLLKEARKGSLDINGSDNRNVLNMAIRSTQNRRDIKKQFIENLLEIYKSPIRKTIETIFCNLWAGFGMVLYSGRINRAYDYGDSAKAFFDRRDTYNLIRKIRD